MQQLKTFPSVDVVVVVVVVDNVFLFLACGDEKFFGDLHFVMKMLKIFGLRMRKSHIFFWGGVNFFLIISDEGIHLRVSRWITGIGILFLLLVQGYPG